MNVTIIALTSWKKYVLEKIEIATLMASAVSQKPGDIVHIISTKNINCYIKFHHGKYDIHVKDYYLNIEISLFIVAIKRRLIITSNILLNNRTHLKVKLAFMWNQKPLDTIFHQK